MILSITAIILLFYAHEIHPYQQHLHTQLTTQQHHKQKIVTEKVQNTDNSYHFSHGSRTYKAFIDGSTLTIHRDNIFVSDNAQVLPSTTQQQIYQLNQTLKTQANGTQLVVITVDHVPDKASDIQDYALDIFNTPGIGQRYLNNGVLYLIAVQDHQDRITVGTGYNEILTDSTCQKILDAKKSRRAYQQNDYSTGVMDVVNKISSKMKNKTPQQDSRIKIIHQKLRQLWYIPIGIILLALVLLSITIWYTDWDLAKSDQLMRQMNQQMQDSLKDNDGTEVPIEAVFKIDLFMLSTGDQIIKQTTANITKRTDQRRLQFRFPDGHFKEAGFVDDDILYDLNGKVITKHFRTSVYASQHWYNMGCVGCIFFILTAPFHSRGFGGGYSGGGYGGGSSSGGGATGGW
ncbi:TPM domain-containing protein [Bombilactobacillus thymidiniphilus]|uniref:TPM domain-containing protein n=1 Tax=Bombilactobacillus thymidiniphilus TaxID=2923363 RepID=A0ABY4PBJ8_9LACO|nr:TPM domain-containing protein [Bombilactobacillus thymidiniphilus]UQS83150.1 TPM domain-containing protein [Bombilactobacillus thymidiniphilus]